jgi:hypothetical protein
MLKKLILLFLCCPSLLYADLSQWNTKALAEDFSCPAPLPAMQFEMTDEYRLHNAFLLLWASALAESRDRKLILSGLKRWGFQDPQLIGKPRHGAFGFFAARNELNLLAFRGTNSFREGLFNTFFLPSSFQALGFEGTGHSGMMHHFKQLLRESEAILRQHDPEQKKPIFVTGHSLGGAMALMHALHLAKNGWPVTAVYTSAQPHVGDAAFYDDVETWLPDRYFRMEQSEDPTPRVPPIAGTGEVFGELIPILSGPLAQLVGRMNYGASRAPYLHISSTLSLESRDPEILEMEYWRDLRGGLENPKSLPDLIQTLQRRMQEHPPQNYMCAFLKALQSRIHYFTGSWGMD